MNFSFDFHQFLSLFTYILKTLESVSVSIYHHHHPQCPQFLGAYSVYDLECNVYDISSVITSTFTNIHDKLRCSNVL